jgi:hypothetical protein
MKTCSPEYLIADLVADCPEVPAELVHRGLMRAAKRMMAVTCMNEQWIDIPTQANVQHYPFERYLPTGYSVQYVTEVKYNGCCIAPVKNDCSMCPVGYCLEDLTQIRLFGYCPQGEDPKDPECTDTLQVKVVLRPNNDLCDLPCDLIDRFEEELRDGALGNILSMKDKPWTDYKVAEFHENRFEGDIASAKCLVQNKMNPEGARMAPECLI